MQSYHRSLTSVPAPLLVVQGISSNLRPIVKEQRSRIIKEQEYENEETKLNYGVQIQIDRELDDLSNECVSRLIKLIDACNVRDQTWWVSQDVHNNQQSQPSASNDLKQRQRISKQLSTTGSQGSRHSKGLWFNVKYCDPKYEIIINGSNSSLSPFNEKGDFYGSLLPLQWIDKYYDYIPSAFISFYEIGNDETFDTLLINEINRIKLKFSNTMLKFVVVLVNLYPTTTTTTRISNILSKINMGSNSIFVINGNNDETSKREQNTFVKKLLIGLRSYSNDFFDVQIQKLKKREIKNIQYNEKFFSTRNLIKLALFEQFKTINEYSTKILEYSYDKLLQLLKTIDKNPTNRIYLEIREWLDIICLHIVRSCIVLGDNNIAYRKFSFHLQKIKALDQDNVSNDWISLQYTWLGELIENINLIEPEILPVDLTILPTIGSREIKFNSYNMPHDGFVFLQAYNYRCKDLVEDNRILLLNAALDAFNMSKLTRLQRFESKIYLLLGDVYYEMGNFSMAINNYFAGISIFKQENCRFIHVFILRKILICYIKLNKLNESKSVYIELCCLDGTEDKPFLDEMKEKIISLDLINDDSLTTIIKEEGRKGEENSTFIKDGVFKFDIGIKKYSNMMNDGVDIQLIITAKGITMIDSLEINDLELDIGGNSEFKKIKILNEATESEVHTIRKLTSVNNETEEALKTSLVFKSEQNTEKSIVLQNHIKSKKVGKFYISKIKTSGTLNDFKFHSILNVNGLDLTKNYFKWYGDNEIIKTTYPTNSFEIIPRIPDIKFFLHYEKIGFNGRRIPIEIKFLNDDEYMNIKLKITGDGKLENVNDIKIDWENNSDDMFKPGDERVVKCHAIIPQVNGLPLTSKDMKDNCIIKFNITYVLVNDGGVEISISKEAKIKVIEMIEWNTRLNPDVKNVEFPNLFKIGDGIDINGHNLPIHLRKWNFKLNLKNNTYDELIIKNRRFSVNGSKGVKLIIHSDDEKDLVFKSMEDIQFNMILEVSCDKIIRTIPVDIKCELEYHTGDNIIQNYVMDIYKANLPHVDPRIVIIIDGFEDDKIVLKYVFENPTERIFQYQTNLNTIPGVEILDYIKTMKINVMPFMQEIIDLKYHIIDDSNILELPEFTVYDKQYKIFVKPSCGDDRLKLIDGHLFLYK